MHEGPLKMLPLFMAPRVVVGLDTPEEVQAFRKGWEHATLEIHKAAFKRGIEVSLKAQPLSDIELTRLSRLILNGRRR